MFKGWNQKPQEAPPLPRDTPCRHQTLAADSKFPGTQGLRITSRLQTTAVSVTGHQGLQAWDRGPGMLCSGRGSEHLWDPKEVSTAPTGPGSWDVGSPAVCMEG